MPRTLKLATVQMDATPAPVTDRLARAGALVAEAAAQGAQLIVLPELFNIGYHYHDENYTCPERLDGQTLTWMKAAAAQHGTHLAGTLLLLDGDEVFNSAFLVAPDGQTWRYDKIFPFAWERAYFREGRNITIAETSLGRFGMLICWDSAHTDLWRRYAGQVDAMVITSCPPAMQDAHYTLPDGNRIHTSALGIPNTETLHFQHMDIEAQARWLHVPVVASTGAGHFRSALPLPLPASLRMSLPMTLEAGYGRYAKIIRADGTVAARVEATGDGVRVAEITLPDAPPQPTTPQPAMHMPLPIRLMVDVVGTAAMIPLYRAGLRRVWGARMAPVDPRTWVWLGLMLTALWIGFGKGRRR
jgi:predicted amidohydrolase